MIHYQNGDYDGTINYFLKSINILEKNDPKNFNLSLTYGNLCIVYTTIKNNAEAIVYGKKALAFAEKTGKKKNLMSANIGLSNAYIYSDSINNYLPYFKKGLEIAKELKDNYFIWTAYNQLN